MSVIICPGIDEYCKIPNCSNKPYHAYYADVNKHRVHLCNKKCKNDDEHKKILKQYNDNIPDKIVKDFKSRNLFINKSNDKVLIQTLDPNKGYDYCSNNNTLYWGKVEPVKSYLKPILLLSIASAAILAFAIPQSRNAIMKTIPKIKNVIASKSMQDFIAKAKTFGKNIGVKLVALKNKIKSSEFIKNILKNQKIIAKTAEAKPQVVAPAVKAVTETAAKAQTVAPAVKAVVETVTKAPTVVESTAQVQAAAVADKFAEILA